MLYSVYAIYASGKDAVLGGMLVIGIGFVIWGFIAPRFAASGASGQVPERQVVQGGLTAADRIERRHGHAKHPTRTPHRTSCPDCRSSRSHRLGAAVIAAAPSSAATLDQIKESSTITLGYRADARPFSFQDDAGAAAGYSVALCRRSPTR